MDHKKLREQRNETVAAAGTKVVRQKQMLKPESDLTLALTFI
jgi:hypothetical protein